MDDTNIARFDVLVERIPRIAEAIIDFDPAARGT